MNIGEEQTINTGNAVLESIDIHETTVKNLKVDILRLDKIHPVISGNKWFKLKYHLRDAIEKKVNTIITFGGAWSNHIIATACVAKIQGFRAIGVIRGERPLHLSKTLEDAISYGMTLEFVDRDAYSRKNDDDFKKILRDKFGDVYFIPEGGSGPPGIYGSMEILSLSETGSYSHIVCCMGTGTMYSGLVSASLPTQVVIGIVVLKGVAFLPEQVTDDQRKRNNMKIMYDYHFGGYAKKTTQLIEFMNNFYIRTGIPTDFVYTGKMIFGFSDLVSRDYFPSGSKILLIHSGGLQGNVSLPPGTLLF